MLNNGHAIIRVAAFAFALASCAKADEPADVPPEVSDLEVYQADVGRLLAEHVQGGAYVVSRSPEGEARHLGEGLLWSGTFLSAAPCVEGRTVSAFLAASMASHGGALVRVDPLGEYAGGREVTVDGAIGLYAGIARRVMSCGDADVWREPFAAHVAFLNANANRLHPNVGGDSGSLGGGLRLLADLLAWRLGLNAEPSRWRMYFLERALAGWAAVRHVGHQACYPVNLGFTALQAAAVLGWATTPQGKAEFCAATRGMDIPTTDHYCGRAPINAYLETYQPDLWEYRFQRCGEPWEQPDGKGNASPRLDRIVALTLKHGWQGLQVAP